MIPYWLQQAFIFAIGSCVGSFFNVVIHRLPLDQSVVLPASHCPECSHEIAPYDNIPLMSWIFLRGRCRHCRSPISIRYPVVEALTGFLALLLFRKYGPAHPQFWVEMLFLSLLIIISFIDLDTMLIPNVLSIPGILLGLVLSLVTPRLTWTDSLIGILIGGGFFYAVSWIYYMVRGEEGIGGGDIKLLAMIGAFTGLRGIAFTVFLSSALGAMVGGIGILLSRLGYRTPIPFGPFLALGAACYLLWGNIAISWYMSSFFPH